MNQFLAIAVGVLGVVGLLGPTLIAFGMIWLYYKTHRSILVAIVFHRILQ